MKILTVHNRYKIRAGEDMSWMREQSLLLSHGHQVINYTRDNAENGRLSSLSTGLRTIWSSKDYRLLQRVLESEKPDVMIVHNFFPLISPAAYYAARKAKVPVVQFLHNYRLLCAGAHLYRQGRICEDCMNQTIPLGGVIHGCYRDSRLYSSAIATMQAVHKILNTWNQQVDIYVALTEFCRDKFVEGGLPAEKIMVKPNFISPDPGIGDGTGGYAIYAGRLTAEKGIDTLISAWKELGRSLPIKIVGEGALEGRVAKAAKSTQGVEYLGPKSNADVIELLKRAKVLVFPSQWYEGIPGSILEAFAVGTPVIASSLGSMDSMVRDFKTGLKFEPGNVEDLQNKMKWVVNHPSEIGEMRINARLEFESKYSAEKNYEALIDIFRKARAVNGHRLERYEYAH